MSILQQVCSAGLHSARQSFGALLAPLMDKVIVLRHPTSIIHLAYFFLERDSRSAPRFLPLGAKKVRNMPMVLNNAEWSHSEDGKSSPA